MWPPLPCRKGTWRFWQNLISVHLAGIVSRCLCPRRTSQSIFEGRTSSDLSLALLLALRSLLGPFQLRKCCISTHEYLSLVRQSSGAARALGRPPWCPAVTSPVTPLHMRHWALWGSLKAGTLQSFSECRLLKNKATIYQSVQQNPSCLFFSNFYQVGKNRFLQN